MSFILQNDYPLNPPIGYSGLLVGPYVHQGIETAKNVELTASIGFGRAVVYQAINPTSDLDVVLPATQNDLVVGIVILLQEYARAFTTTDKDGNTVTTGELDGFGLRPGTLMAILRKGKILVTCDTGCAPYDRLFVRSTAVAGFSVGGLGNAPDGTNTIDCTRQGQWLTSAPPGGFAELQVDFLNKP